MQFSLLHLAMNVILMLLHYLAKVEKWKRNITVRYYQRKFHQMYRITSWNGPVDYKIWGVMQQYVYETKICDIGDLCKLSLTLNRTLYRGCDLTSGATIWDHVCMCACWCRKLWTHAVKLLFIMAALWNRAGHYILPCDFYLLSIFFPRLISAVGDWMSAILSHMVWP